jgi:hypothetical protein
LIERDLFGKPLHTFPNHALAGAGFADTRAHMRKGWMLLAAQRSRAV